MNSKRNLILFAFFSFLWVNTFGNAPQIPVIFQSGKAEIVLKDYLHQPLYWWPSTLLTYPVVFNETVSFGELILKDKATGRQIPFQISDFQKNKNGKQEAVLYILTDLPSGGEYTFLLQKGTPERFTPVSVSETGQQITVQTDKLEIRLPKSSSTQNPLPGPVFAIGQRGSKSMGSSSFNPGKRTLKQLDTKIVKQGPLFVEVEEVYLFSDGARYQANIRCVNGYDFVEIKEQMEGFPDADQANWEIRWEGFSPTHRQAPNHPYGYAGDEPGFLRYKWETVNQNMLNSHHGIMYAPSNGKIPFEVGIYGNWPAERTVTSTVFWDEKGMQSVGAFTKDIAFWDDHEYSIWASSGKLNVKFYYNDQLLRWIYPVCKGERLSGLSCYSHRNDIQYIEEQERLSLSKEPARPTRISQLSYNTFLQNRHSTIDLNKVKDWDLSYPEPLRIPEVVFPRKEFKQIQDLERNFFYGGYSNELAISGPCQNSYYAPVPARSFSNSYVVAFNQLLPQMTPEQRERLSAMFLVHAYMAAGEEYMPMRVMLSGHPNFLADVRIIPALAAFLFPEHSQAKNWSDMFAKYVELNTHYHTRPNVNSWDAQGGRWTENLGTYVWGFIGPTVKADYLIQNFGSGKNHLANKNMAQIGSWIMNSLSAPYEGESIEFYRNKFGKLEQHFWGIVTKEEGPRRVHPPQGAHAARRKPSSTLWLIGQSLQNYQPLLAENIRFVSNPEDQEQERINREENSFDLMYPTKDYDTGTPPDFKSIKMTGYGIVLRAAVGTKDELSIHLQQIDKGPNYRWGTAAEGGSGNIYFFAAGKSYSHNGREDSGDRKTQDTDLATNFGAFKNGYFKSIGMNELSRPLYDLSVGQFAELISSNQTGFSWPDYQSRSIMLVGSDYFITYDDVYNNNIGSRFSWFTHPHENLPEITVIKCGGMGFDHIKFKADKTELVGHESKGLWYDGLGDIMTFVSHKKDFQITPASYGSIITTPSGGKDYIFRNDTPVKNDSAYIFSGKAGFIRERTDGKQEIALFHGTKIGNTQFEIQTTNEDAGISAIYTDPAHIKGEYYAYEPVTFTFHWTQSLPDGISFYLNGEKLPSKTSEKELTVTFPAGRHIWNLSAGLPALSRPEIQSTRNVKGSVSLALKPVAGAQRYRYEYSADAITNWKVLKEQAGREINIKPEKNEKKGYVRVIALNAEHQSEASVIYPLYFTLEKPHYPEGLKLEITGDKLSLDWGQALGSTEFRLYKREIGSAKYQLIYKGSENRFEDIPVKGKLYEYVVTAVNGNGESKYSLPVDNDPNSWLNFDPVPGEPFRRVGTRSVGNDNMGNKVEAYYPK